MSISKFLSRIRLIIMAILYTPIMLLGTLTVALLAALLFIIAAIAGNESECSRIVDKYFDFDL